MTVADQPAIELREQEEEKTGELEPIEAHKMTIEPQPIEPASSELTLRGVLVGGPWWVWIPRGAIAGAAGYLLAKAIHIAAVWSVAFLEQHWLTVGLVLAGGYFLLSKLARDIRKLRGDFGRGFSWSSSEPASISRTMRAHIWHRDGKECRYCGRYLHTLSLAHIDHVIPVIQGGTNNEDNLVLACRKCNLKKGGRRPLEAGMRDHRGSWLNMLR